MLSIGDMVKSTSNVEKSNIAFGKNDIRDVAAIRLMVGKIVMIDGDDYYVEYDKIEKDIYVPYKKEDLVKIHTE